MAHRSILKYKTKNWTM